MSGWIKLQRDIMDHWIAQDNEYLAVWIRMLAEANFETQTKMFNGQVLTVERGQFIFGLESYAEKTKVSVMRLRRLLDLLEKHQMINRVKRAKYSIISIVNYDKYQADNRQTTGSEQAENNQRTTREQPENNTIRSKELKELKEGEELKKKDICQQTDDCQTVFDYWCEVMGKSGNAKLTTKRKNAVIKRLAEGYTVEHIKQAIDGCKRSPFHMGQNENKTVYDDLELICRDGGNLEKFALNVGVVQNGLSTSIQGYEDFVNER